MRCGMWILAAKGIQDESLQCKQTMIFYMIDRVTNLLFTRLCTWHIHCTKSRPDFAFGGFVLLATRAISFRIHVGEAGCVTVPLLGKDKTWLKEAEGRSAQDLL